MPCLDQERQFSLTFAHWSVFRNSVKLLYSTGKPQLWICPLPCCGWTMQEHSHQLKERTELTESVRWGKRCVKLGSLQHLPPPVGFNTTSELKVQGFCQKLKLPTPQRLQRYPFVIFAAAGSYFPTHLPNACRCRSGKPGCSGKHGKSSELQSPFLIGTISCRCSVVFLHQ